MKAMIFAAGLGTRLKPFTLHHPKALVEVKGMPMLQQVIEKLKAIGVNEFVVNVHHFAEQIEDFLNANNSFNVTIHISNERERLMDTGGGIALAARWLEGQEPILIHNADIYTDLPISAMLDYHISNRCIATLAVASRSTSRYLLFDNTMDMKAWTNLKTGTVKPAGQDITHLLPLAFGGVHIISPDIIPMISAYSSEPFSITDFYINKCQEIKIKGYKIEDRYYWHDVGKPESLVRANMQ